MNSFICFLSIRFCSSRCSCVLRLRRWSVYLRSVRGELSSPVHPEFGRRRFLVVRILCKDEGSSCTENVFVVRIDGCELSFVWIVDGRELFHPKAPLKFRCELTSCPAWSGPRQSSHSSNATLVRTHSPRNNSWYYSIFGPLRPSLAHVSIQGSHITCTYASAEWEP